MAFFEENIKEETPNTLWVEKYRPKKLEDYVGNEHLKQKIRDYIESGDVPHLLLFGKAGTGKTTLAKLIVNSINCDFMIYNNVELTEITFISLYHISTDRLYFI
jgi:replication-associated recombination protein RarA